MEYENILLEKKETVALITFNRPKVLNALNSNLLAEFGHALDSLAADSVVKVLVLTGAGEKAFVAGADINEVGALDVLSAKRFARSGQQIISKLQALPFPVIAAVNGFALGGGCEIAMACDFIHASENAKFGLPEITLGVIPGFGGTQRFSRLVGRNLAKEMIFTGGMIKAEQAMQIGLVNKVFPAEELMTAVMQTAQKIAGFGRVALRSGKEAINKGLDVDLNTGCEIEADAFAICYASEDAKEGTSAFLEKRKPNFK